MSKIQYLTKISTELPIDKIYTRLGYRKNKTVITKNTDDKITDYIYEGFSKCEPKAAYLITYLDFYSNNSIVINNHLKVKSKKLTEFLEDSNKIVVMAATAGEKICDLIKENYKNDITASAIFDAVGSETVESVLDELINIIKRKLFKQGLKLMKKRFSPGYGDLDISYQKKIFDLLRLNKIGINITDKMILQPEKSVIALAGIKTKMNRK